MGMQADFEQIPMERLNAFINKPQNAYRYYLDGLNDEVEGALPTMMESMAAAASNPTLSPKARADIEEAMKRFQAMLSTFQRPSGKPRLAVVEKRKKFSLQKDWHVLHYALNGTTEGGEGWVGQAVLGGKEIPDLEKVMGYGPLRYLDAEEVEAVATALSATDPDSLLAKLKKEDAESKHIYLAHTLDDLDDWSYLPKLFAEFRDFYTDAQEQRNGMLLAIT